MLTIQAIPAFQDNYIWIIQAEGSQHVLIVDPGESAPVVDAIKQHDWIPVAILITHGCHDHVDGIEGVLRHFDVPVYGPKNEFIPHITHPLSANEGLVIDPLFAEFRILDLPGHTKGHIGFLIEGNLFCGDTLFGAGCGRLHAGPAELMFESMQKIKKLPPSTTIFCAHEYTQDNLRFALEIEPNNADIQQRVRDTDAVRKQSRPTIPSSLALELATNPFLRCTDAESFRLLRLKKDQFA